MSDVKIRCGDVVSDAVRESICAAQGADRVVLRAQMGHTTEAMTVRYAGIRPETLSEQIGGVIAPLTGHPTGHHPKNEEI